MSATFRNQTVGGTLPYAPGESRIPAATWSGSSIQTACPASVISSNRLMGTPLRLVEAFSVTGDFDILALWQGKNTEEIMKNTVEKLNTFEDFSKTETLLGRHPFFKP